MVMTQGTEPSQASSGDSVRITAAVRRQVLKEHYENEARKQDFVVAFEENDLKVLRQNYPERCAASETRLSNAKAVRQFIGSFLAAYSDNREF